MRLRWGALVALTWLGCPAPIPPGDVAMGQYAMTASGAVRDQCALDEVNGADFTFNATLTRDSASQVAWVTLNGYSREGTFDGQVVTNSAEANRVFVRCAKCSTRVVETLTVAVLSRSQNEAVSGLCPESALDGGVTTKLDAGIVPPGLTTQGYDAVRLCGGLMTTVVALGIADGGACAQECSGCTVRYQLRGERR